MVGYLLRCLAVLIGVCLSLMPAHAAEKILRIATIAAPPTLGNPYGGVGPPSSFVWNALFDTLVTPGDNGDLEPSLALTWNAIEPTRWRFTLRPNVVFSNGEPFDSTAVAATLMWLRSDEGRRTNVGSEVSTIVDAKAIDPLTVDIITNRPDAILPKRLTAASIVAPRAWAELGAEGFAQMPSGTGPFVLKNWKENGSQIRLEANRKSWRAPLIDGIVFVVTSDAVTRTQTMLAGRLDILNVISPELAQQFEGTAYKTVISPTPQVYGLAFNTAKRPNSAVADVRVRQALNYAVDKVAITKIVMHDTMTPASQGSTPVTFGFNPALKPYPHDLAMARKLLADAGHGNGLKLTAEIVINGLPGDAGFLDLIQQNLREVGVDLEIRAIVFPDWLRKYNSGTFETDMFGLSWNGAPFYDVVRAASYHSCLKPNPFFCDPAIVPLFEASDVEFDVEKRRALLYDLSAKLRDLAPTIFLFEVTDISVVSPEVSGYQLKWRVPVYEKLDLTRK
ncbi:MAG: ABC transporter substrate-binding protein [Rhodospirillaceae bacterium]|nr:ABC transporter substrate-binding protein [Rhodospirillaceae bacterium]